MLFLLFLSFLLQDLPSDDDGLASPLYLFLLTHRLQNYLPLLAKEDVDLESLLLLTEDDLVAMNMPLGPRRKLLKAIQDRNDQLQHTEHLYDIRL